MRHKITRLAAIALGALLCGCASPPQSKIPNRVDLQPVPQPAPVPLATPTAPPPADTMAIAVPNGSSPPTPAVETDDSTNEALEQAQRNAKRGRLSRQLSIARQKLAQVQMQSDHQDAEHGEDLATARSEREIAGRKFADFTERDAPLRLDKAKLALRRAEDGAQESAEELEQLEMMYSEAELGEKTAEIVLTRARRRLERARWQLNIQSEEFNHLEQFELPLQRTELDMKLQQATTTLGRKQRSIDVAMLGKKIEIMSAESEVKRLMSELTTLDLE